MPKENRKVKNSVLIDLFYEDESAESNQRSLYNALHEKPLPDGAKILPLRVENIIYMNFQNDFSYETDGKIIVIGEHQATINFNMPLRSLMYIGRIYEQLVPVRDRYKKGQVMLPKPEFFTFYNGTEPMEKELVLKLSNAFKVQDGKTPLELEVKVININPEAQHELLEKCQVMKEYGLFIDMIRKYQQSEAENAYELAIKECIKKGILADYLKKKGSEVINMLQAEYDYELDIEVQREEAYEDGVRVGEQTGRAKGICEGKREGIREGRMNGIQEEKISLVIKKVRRGKKLETVAEEMEEPVTSVQDIYEAVVKAAPDYDMDAILKSLGEKH